MAVELHGLSALGGRVYCGDFMFPIAVLGASWVARLFLLSLALPSEPRRS